MKRSELGPGRKSLERGSTFVNTVTELQRRTPSKQPRPGFAGGHKQQRAKIRELVSIVSGDGPCDPAHLWPRSLGGCDHRDCVVPLTRLEHRAFDDGRLDLLPYLISHRMVTELQHALGHANGDVIHLLNRVTGTRWAPEPTT